MTRWPRPMLMVAGLVLCACGGGKDAADALDAVHSDVIEDGEAVDAAVEADADVPALPRLRAEGTRLVTGDGTPIVLRGVALGGWMFHETWITQVEMPAHARLQTLADASGLGAEVQAALAVVGPVGNVEAASDEPGAELAAWKQALRDHLAAIDQAALDALFAAFDAQPSVYDDADLGLRKVWEARFGIEGRDELLDTFQGAWLAEPDLQWIAQQGFNLVRVPIGYRDLLSETDSSALPQLTWNPRALTRLDALLDQCARAGLYAVLDLQESPGGHNPYSGPARLYDDPEAQALTVSLWTYLVERFGSHPAVGMWSLLAEPYSAPDAATRDAMYDKLVKAIRATGDDHLCVIHDGFLGMGTLPVATEMGWTQVVYSTHLFEWDFTSVAAYEAYLGMLSGPWAKAQASQGVPWYIGSFSTMRDEGWAAEAAGTMAAWYEQNDWAWTLWTYKRIEDPVERLWENTAWGLREGLIMADRPDIYADDFETLKTKLAAYATLPLQPNTALVDAILGR